MEKKNGGCVCLRNGFFSLSLRAAIGRDSDDGNTEADWLREVKGACMKTCGLVKKKKEKKNTSAVSSCDLLLAGLLFLRSMLVGGCVESGSGVDVYNAVAWRL